MPSSDGTPQSLLDDPSDQPEATQLEIELQLQLSDAQERIMRLESHIARFLQSFDSLRGLDDDLRASLEADVPVLVAQHSGSDPARQDKRSFHQPGASSWDPQSEWKMYFDGTADSGAMDFDF